MVIKQIPPRYAACPHGPLTTAQRWYAAPTMDESEFFFRLTPDRVLEAVESGGFQTTGHCTALNALENRVYDVRVDGEGGDTPHRNLVAKFYRPGRWSRDAILDEHRMLGALRDAEIPVCAPLAFDSGETLREVEGIFYALWPRTGGRSPDEFSDAQIEVLGRLLARIHAAGEGVAAPHRLELCSQTFPLAALETLERGAFLPPACAKRYRQAVERVVAIYDDWSEGVSVQPIHGDCHAGNLLHGEDGWFFLDFDDMVVGPAVHDVWMLLPGRDAYAQRQRTLFVEAYQQLRSFDTRSLRLIEPLRAFRFVWYAGWIARRWEDPCFPDAFPHFGTEDYWETETRDLEELVERIANGVSEAEGGEISAPPSEDESELTNKDFFWDL
jgi:Ser/Thr protein kinase RdoA (MazF antagonist)